MNKKRPDLREQRTIQFLSFPVLSQGVCVCVFWLYREACVACGLRPNGETGSQIISMESVPRSENKARAGPGELD